MATIRPSYKWTKGFARAQRKVNVETCNIAEVFREEGFDVKIAHNARWHLPGGKRAKETSPEQRAAILAAIKAWQNQP